MSSVLWAMILKGRFSMNKTLRRKIGATSLIELVSSDKKAVLMYECKDDWLESYLNYEVMKAICMILEGRPFVARGISPFWGIPHKKYLPLSPFFQKSFVIAR